MFLYVCIWDLEHKDDRPVTRFTDPDSLIRNCRLVNVDSPYCNASPPLYAPSGMSMAMPIVHLFVQTSAWGTH